MIEYKSFDIGDGAKLRVRRENIVATRSSKSNNQIEMYVAGLSFPFHLPIQDNSSARKMMDLIWERNPVEEED